LTSETKKKNSTLLYLTINNCFAVMYGTQNF